jgi:hypothetical protein
MPDLTFLDKLPVSLQILLGLPFAYMGYLLFAKGVRDKLFSTPPASDTREEFRQRWEGPVGKHLEHMEAIADGLGRGREVYARIEAVRSHLEQEIAALENRIRECERSIDRLPSRR